MIMTRFVTCLVLLTVAAPVSAADYQKLADEAKWEWDPERATVLHATLNYHEDYQVEIVKKPNTFGDLTVRFTKDGKEALTVKGSYATTFVGKDSILYYTEYHPSASGCALVAYDLANRKQLWKTPLKGLGPIAHFQYSNLVTVDLVGDAVKVLGNESAGHYVEFVDLKTGKTVGHKVFPR
jgi:hypothetical protein